MNILKSALQMRTLVIIFSAIVAAVAFHPAPVSAQTVAQLSPSTIATDWLGKSICADSLGRPVPFDPYYVCPIGTTRRKLQVGEPLPYNNFDQEYVGFVQRQGHHSIPVTSLSGNILYVNTYDYRPFDVYNLYEGSDGGDIYTIQNGWATALNTQDGGGYSTTFFGSGCTVGNAWNFFPESGFLSGGSQTIPIFGVYWEQSG